MTSRKSTITTGSFLALLAACLAIPRTACADRLVVDGKEYAAVEIVGLRSGRLRYRLASGSLQETWADEVERIYVAHGGAFLDFNQAEQLAADGKHAAAVSRYTRALRLVEGFWQDLISMRLVTSSDKSGDIDDAVEHYVRLLLGPNGGPEAAARLIPHGIPKKRNAKVTRALARLNAKLRSDADLTDSQEALLRIVHYEILRRTGDKETVPAAARLVQMSIPQSARSADAYETIRGACVALFQANNAPVGLRGVDTAIRDCPRASLPGFLLLKGRTLLGLAKTRTDIIRAAWPLLRVVIHFGKDRLAPEALYESALALERIGRNRQAIDLLGECRNHRLLDASIGGLAAAAQKRLQSRATD